MCQVIEETLQFSKQGTECLHMKTFGNYEGQNTICDVVEISVITRERERVFDIYSISSIVYS